MIAPERSQGRGQRKEQHGRGGLQMTGSGRGDYSEKGTDQPFVL